MWAGNQRNGGGVFFFNVWKCVYCLEKMVRPVEHQQRERTKRDILSFRLELLAKGLIGNFSSSQRAGGRPCSTEHAQLDRLNLNLGNWPTHVGRKGNCAVCLAVNRRSLPSVVNRH